MSNENLNNEARIGLSLLNAGLGACGLCLYWKEIPPSEEVYDAVGACRRFPPTHDVTWPLEAAEAKMCVGNSWREYRAWTQPVTEEGDWCGEFRATPNVKVSGRPHHETEKE